MLVDPTNEKIMWGRLCSNQDTNNSCISWPTSINSWHRVVKSADQTIIIPQSTPEDIIESSYYPGLI